jgi:hypothetical protein
MKSKQSYTTDSKHLTMLLSVLFTFFNDLSVEEGLVTCKIKEMT